MPTLKKRINITLEPDIEKLVEKLAKRDKKPTAAKVAELLALALEIEEDAAWDALASERDKKGVKYISHAKVWGL